MSIGGPAFGGHQLENSAVQRAYQLQLLTLLPGFKQSSLDALSARRVRFLQCLQGERVRHPHGGVHAFRWSRFRFDAFSH